MMKGSSMQASSRLRWLGTAGLEISIGDTILAIDPFFTRPSLREVLFGRMRPDGELAAALMPRCDYVLITHPHYDHLMDVPNVVRQTKAQAFGSSNSCALLALLGVPEEKIREIKPEDHLTLGDIRCEVLHAEHRPLFGLRLATGTLKENIELPLRSTDYRMDECFSFKLRVGELDLLISSGLRAEHASPADVLLVAPYGERTDFEALLQRVRPRLVIPNHWDDFFRPLSEPLLMMRDPSDWLWPPLRRVDLGAFERIVRASVPEARLLIPEMLEEYDLDALLQN